MSGLTDGTALLRLSDRLIVRRWDSLVVADGDLLSPVAVRDGEEEFRALLSYFQTPRSREEASQRYGDTGILDFLIERRILRHIGSAGTPSKNSVPIQTNCGNVRSLNLVTVKSCNAGCTYCLM